LHSIRSVALYESKLLKRSWFYRIFFVLAILFLGIFNFVALVWEGNPGFWLMKALPAVIPYANLLYLNTGQAIIAVFLSSEFLKSDKKLDTSEVFYVHPLSNAEYVIGKIWGNARVFIQLDLLIILLVVIFNLISGVAIDWLAYLGYFLLICIPTLIYIFGLSISLMLILKSQAVTFVVLLGYIALTLFNIGDKFYYLFDYMAYNLPLVKSTIVGLTNWAIVINHRLIYLLLGLGFICLSIFLFRRLPNSKKASYRWFALSILLIVIGAGASYRHVVSFTGAAAKRQLYTETNNRYVHTPKMVVERYGIDLQQRPRTIISEVEMQGVALEKSNRFTFCLNPGLQASEVTENGTSLTFTREHQILLIDFGRVLEAGDSVRFTVKYEGRVDPGFCYLDIPNELLEEEYANQGFQIDKRYSFQKEDYVLFTPETYWYPRPGTSYSSESPDWQQAYFSHFRLKVTTLDNLKALSQGTMEGEEQLWEVKRTAHPDEADEDRDTRDTSDAREIKGDRDTSDTRGPSDVSDTRGARDALRTKNLKEVEEPKEGEGANVFLYETDFPTPSITLIIGDYERKSVEVDSTLYSVCYLRGNDYFSDVFESIADTIPAQIRERRRSLESNYNLDYSFHRLSLVEVPVQFYSYARTWTQAQEVMQPEMILLPERGCLIDDANVAGGVENEKRWAERRGQEISDEDAALRVLNRFLGLFQRAESNMDWSRERGAVNVSMKPNPYFIFPQLYNYRYNVFSSEWAVANRLIELYLQDRSEEATWMRQMNGISNNEKANLLMEQASFKELLADGEHRDLLDNIISLKGNYLFAYAEQQVGYNEYRDSLRNLLQRNVFANIRFENLLDTMGALAEVDLHAPLEAWNHPTPLPVYILSTPEIVQITNRDQEVFVTKIQITNDSDYDGVINLDIFFGGQNIYDPRAKRKIALAAHETKRIVSVWDEMPRNINVNTLISGNLPSSINLPVSNVIRERNKPIDEEGDFIVENVSYDVPGEVIVDNEDSTLFVLTEPEVVGLLPQWLDQMDKGSFDYSGVSNWRPPLQWTLTTNDRYYGTRVRSAYVIKSGSGNQTATWKVPVPNAGTYDLFYWVYKPDDVRHRGGWGRGGGRGRTRGDAEYRFQVHYDGGEDAAYIDLRRADDGWSLLGTYFFSEDTVRVVLSDECKLRSVTADAVRIVRR
jgi:ABC-type transport system involved in multi-copper enzyme maturation permease subunit